MINRYLIVLNIISLLSGCATMPGPVTMTCSAIGKAQLTSPGSRIDLRHFSVKMPDDAEKWCIADSDTSRLGLYTHALMGQYIEKPERHMALNTVVLAAMELNHGTSQLDSVISLQKFVEEWIERGFGAEFIGTNIKVMHSSVPNFTVQRFNVTPDPTHQAICVRYEYQMEERNNRNAPNTILVLDEYGLICQHPRTISNIVSMALSERYPKGEQINPSLFQQLKHAAADTFFGSLRF